MEDYKKKYEDALERAKEELGSGCFNKGSIEYIFPELKVSEDERIREELIDAIHGLWDNDALPMPLSVKRKDEWISWLEKQVSPQMVADAYLRGCNDTEKKWLESKRYTKMDVDNAYLEGIANAKREFEKQGKCEADCPQNHQDVNHPNGCITMEDFNGGEGFYKLNIEYLNKRQVEEIEEIVRTWNKDADCDLCTSKEHCISIEKQDTIKDGDSIDPHFGKPITTAETKTPKFKVGDKVLWKYDKSDVRTIAKISDYGTYWIECPGCGSGWWTDDELEPYVESDWTEEDERLLNGIYYTLEGIAPLSYEKELDWLKSIKERVHPKSQWTEDDEKMFEEYKLGIQALMNDSYVEKFCNWIFALKQRLQ